MKRELLLLLACLPILANGAIEIDGIYYNIDDSKRTAEVTYKDNKYGSYSGDVVIPSAVEYKGFSCPVTSIGFYAFRDCANLTSVFIPGSVNTIGMSSFLNCKKLVDITISDGVKTIERGAFIGTSSLTSVILPNSVTEIGQLAFNGTNLQSISFSNQLTTIGNEAFRGCSKLEAIHIPGSVVTIGEKAFHGCGAATSLTIGNGVITIGESAFYGCGMIPSVVIPNSVTSLGGYAFYNCRSLTNAVLSDNLTTISGGLFEGCSSLSSVIIPDGVTTIEGNAFKNCSSLSTVTIPNGVTSIGGSAFRDCNCLTSINIPSTVTSIGRMSFSSLSNLKVVYCHAIKLPNTYGDIFNNSEPGFATLYVPAVSFEKYNTTSPWNQFGEIEELEDGPQDGVLKGKTIEGIDMRFIVLSEQEKTCMVFGTKQMPTIDKNTTGQITIPSEVGGYKVKRIGIFAFYGCNDITSVTIPFGITSIGDEAFAGCNGLTKVTALMEMPYEIGANVFTKYNIPLYVPFGTAPLYSMYTTWNMFSDIIEDGAAPSPGVNPEAYMLQSNDGRILSFYYDEKKALRNGTDGTVFTADLFREQNSLMNQLTQTVIFNDTFAQYHGVSSTANWFSLFWNLTTIIGLKNLNTENVTDMSGMFAHCKKLTSLDLTPLKPKIRRT